MLGIRIALVFLPFLADTLAGTECFLPAELGSTGQVTFLEDCPNVSLFENLPWPAPSSQKLGTHPVVCCPTLTASEEVNGTVESYDYDDEPVGSVYRIPTMADQNCAPYGTFISLPGIGNLTECVSVNHCDRLLDSVDGLSSVRTCGFDDSSMSMMICCPKLYVDDPQLFLQKPRFSFASGSTRKCEDKHALCGKWKENGGCKLEVDNDLFDFMQGACMDTCGWCGDKGCIDEHPKCQEWAGAGKCITNPFIMVHMCRESCGVCGFLSVDNVEEQRVGGRSYTDFTKDDFECGRYKKLCEINGEECKVEEKSNESIDELEPKDTAVIREENEYVDLELENSLDSDDVFFSNNPDSSTPGEYFCSAVMISDRWVLSAAHCYLDKPSTGSRSVRINTIRDNTNHKEIVEIKRVYPHPLYEYPKMYNDIVLGELGRRVQYDYAVFGDSPACLDQGQDLVNQTATVQGYGLTEDGTRGDLLEADVPIISNQLCKEYLQHNTSHHPEIKKKINRVFPLGLDYGLFCNHGFLTDEGVFTGACDGDSGGPVTVEDEKTGIQTLVGIISGGIGCGAGVPGWNIKVAFFKDWIGCVVKGRMSGGSPEEVKDKCKGAVIDLPTCEDLSEKDLIFEDMMSKTDCENFGKKKEDGIEKGDLYFKN